MGFLAGGNDLWWTIRDESSARLALDELVKILGDNGVRFFDSLTTNSGILAVYKTGEHFGFEIDRDEARLVLLAETGASDEARQRVHEYDARWPRSPAAERASKFLSKYRVRYALCEEMTES